MKVRIDHDLCTGHGRCYSVAPSLFTDDERGYGQVIGDGNVSAEQEEEAQRAKDACPERCVIIETSPAE